MTLIAKLARSLGGVLAPGTCPGCGARGEPTALCSACRLEIGRLSEPQCALCSVPGRFLGAGSDEPRCEACRDGRVFRRAVAFGPFEGFLKDLVTRLKYGNEKALGPALGGLAREAGDLHFDLADYDALVPVPLHPTRLRERGYNQSFLLARAVAEAQGLPVVHALVRCRPGLPQVGLEGDARRENVAEVFALHPLEAADSEGLSLLLVDDVFTTGATVEACARTLLGSGLAAVVDVLTVARTA